MGMEWVGRRVEVVRNFVWQRVSKSRRLERSGREIPTLQNDTKCKALTGWIQCGWWVSGLLFCPANCSILVAFHLQRRYPSFQSDVLWYVQWELHIKKYQIKIICSLEVGLVFGAVVWLVTYSEFGCLIKIQNIGFYKKLPKSIFIKKWDVYITCPITWTYTCNVWMLWVSILLPRL